ncbi:MAG: flagellar basal body-associated protein FliL [Sphingomonadaceae bacterium]
MNDASDRNLKRRRRQPKGNVLSGHEASIGEPDGDEGLGVVKPRPNRRLFLLGGGVLALLLIAGAAAWFLMSPTAGKEAAVAEAHGAGDSGDHDKEGPVYVDAPAMVVNLQGADGTARFIKIRFTFVPASASKSELIEDKLPVIVDAFQPFLRELRPEDLAGSAALFRIKEEMLVRANGAMGPGVVKDILIQDLIQQ